MTFSPPYRTVIVDPIELPPLPERAPAPAEAPAEAPATEPAAEPARRDAAHRGGSP